jgi:transcriptional regulator with PAS, ATPase and Fis domain
LILRALDRVGGHHERAAKILGISARTLSRKLKIYLAGEAAPKVMPQKRGMG